MGKIKQYPILRHCVDRINTTGLLLNLRVTKNPFIGLLFCVFPALTSLSALSGDLADSLILNPLIPPKYKVHKCSQPAPGSAKTLSPNQSQ